MKNELKISTLSIVCVLCTAIAMPALGATAVRSLGGTGTYSSASSAATAKSTGNSTDGKATNSVRGGSMRVGTSTGSSRAATSRATSSPRLSIGKYLAGSSAVNSTTKPGTSSGGSTSGSGGNGNLQTRIEILEQFMGYTENGTPIKDVVADLAVDVEALQNDMSAITGEHTTVEYADGVLTVKQNDKVSEFDLADYFATKTGLQDLEDKINDLTIPSLDGLVTDEELRVMQTVLENAIKAKQDAGDYVKVDALEELKTTVDKLESESASNEVIAELNKQVEEIAANYATDADIQAVIDAIDLTSFAKVSDLNSLRDSIDANAALIAENVADVASLEQSVAAAASEAADAKLAAGSAQNLANQNAEDIIELQNAGYVTSGALTAYVKSADLAKVATTGSYADLTDKPTLITQDDLTALRTALEGQIGAKADSGDVATADALRAVSDSLATLKNDSYTKTEIDKKIADAVTGGQINLDGYATVDALNSAISALQAKDTELSNGLMALTESLSSYVKSDDLATVAKTGAYSDLSGTPDLTQYVTATQVENSVTTALNSYEIPDGSITAAKIKQGAVTSDKINTELGAGEMVMLMSNGDGTSSWVAVTVDAE